MNRPGVYTKSPQIVTKKTAGAGKQRAPGWGSPGVENATSISSRWSIPIVFPDASDELGVTKLCQNAKDAIAPADVSGALPS